MAAGQREISGTRTLAKKLQTNWQKNRHHLASSISTKETRDSKCDYEDNIHVLNL